jgi:hypothetical protein
MSFNLPNTIVNGQTRDARPVQANFAAITSALQNDFVRADGSVAMTGTLQLSGSPIAGNHAATKDYVDGVGSVPVGVILDFGGDVAPDGFALAQGQLVSKTDNPMLWALFGNKYGTSTTTQFYLPDLRLRFVVGKGAQSWADTLGEKGGSKDAILVQHNHGHARPFDTVDQRTTLSGSGTYVPDIKTDRTSTEGESGTDKNLPPYIVMNKIVRMG